MKASTDSMFLGGSMVVVLIAIVAGLFVLGSPSQERARSLDDRRVADLRDIMAATDLYWTRHERLPATMTELTDEPGVQVRISDPVTAEPYRFHPGDSASYELCATFDLESRDVARRPEGDIWSHGPGAQCFPLTAKEIERDQRRGGR